MRIRLVTGDPTTQILKMVEKESADMIVLASRGQGQQGKSDTEFGHVAATVIRSSPVPVHIINRQDRE